MPSSSLSMTGRACGPVNFLQQNCTLSFTGQGVAVIGADDELAMSPVSADGVLRTATSAVVSAAGIP